MKKDFSARAIAKLTGMTTANVYRRAYNLGLKAKGGFSEKEAYQICTYERKGRKYAVETLEQEVDRLQRTMKRMGIVFEQAIQEDEQTSLAV